MAHARGLLPGAVAAGAVVDGDQLLPNRAGVRSEGPGPRSDWVRRPDKLRGRVTSVYYWWTVRRGPSAHW